MSGKITGNSCLQSIVTAGILLQEVTKHNTQLDPLLTTPKGKSNGLHTAKQSEKRYPIQQNIYAISHSHITTPLSDPPGLSNMSPYAVVLANHPFVLQQLRAQGMPIRKYRSSTTGTAGQISSEPL